jgi:hypothetical protein
MIEAFEKLTSKNGKSNAFYLFSISYLDKENIRSNPNRAGNATPEGLEKIGALKVPVSGTPFLTKLYGKEISDVGYFGIQFCFYRKLG